MFNLKETEYDQNELKCITSYYDKNPTTAKKKKKKKSPKRDPQVQMRIPHRHHMTWISALTLSAFSCAAAQNRTPSEAAAAAAPAAPSTLPAAACDHEQPGAPPPGRSGELRAGQLPEEEVLPVVQALAQGNQRPGQAERRLSAPGDQGGSGDAASTLLTRSLPRALARHFSRLNVRLLAYSLEYF